ncbi:MAG: tRNA pseudouridine(13) synthase TruD [Planctomycetes bacterium]|nr:tRNA pseudouridine(13) synthase TruD [Planctomycetota bacterium]
MNAEMPLVTAHLPGVGGALKSRPADFVVEELPLYLPSGSGEHVYLSIVREGATTKEIESALGRLFALPSRAIGTAGMKDKQARTTQTFSLHLHEGEPLELARRVEGELGLRVLSSARHANKLRMGHLLGNRFRVLLRDAHPEALTRAQAITDELSAHGLPNAFGPQRFGADGDNAERARALFAQPKRGWTAELLLSAWQSAQFHAWLAQRHALGKLPGLLEGDVAKRHDGPIFDVLDLALEEPRLRAREIVPTGPLFGESMRWAKGAALQIEESVLRESGIDAQALARARLPGTRRAAWIYPRGFELEAEAQGLWVGFELPKGSYATVVLREFTKSDALSAD